MATTMQSNHETNHNRNSRNIYLFGDTEELCIDDDLCPVGVDRSPLSEWRSRSLRKICVPLLNERSFANEPCVTTVFEYF